MPETRLRFGDFSARKGIEGLNLRDLIIRRDRGKLFEALMFHFTKLSFGGKLTP